MEIRSGKYAMIEFVYLHISCVIFIILGLMGNNSYLFLGIVMGIWNAYCNLYYMRRFYLDKTGITVVTLGRFRTYYAWYNFVVKQVVVPKKSFGHRFLSSEYEEHYRSMVVLSTKRIRGLPKVNYIHKEFHPLSCVFIGFEEDAPECTKDSWYTKSIYNRENRGFEVDRSEFISKMKEWGIDIKGLEDEHEQSKPIEYGIFQRRKR